MINKIVVTGITLSALLLSGCGGGGGKNTDPMNDKNYIIVEHNVESGICESADFASALTYFGVKDFITRETDTTTSCATYGKVNDAQNCLEEFVGGGSVNCVIGFNELPEGENGLARRTTPSELYDTSELISVSFK